MLHDREGGAAHDLEKRYDADTTPGLAALAGKRCKGTWTLRIQDAAAEDAGKLLSFGLDLSFAHPDRAPRTFRTPTVTRRRRGARKS